MRIFVEKDIFRTHWHLTHRYEHTDQRTGFSFIAVSRELVKYKIPNITLWARIQYRLIFQLSPRARVCHDIPTAYLGGLQWNLWMTEYQRTKRGSSSTYALSVFC